MNRASQINPPPSFLLENLTYIFPGGRALLRDLNASIRPGSLTAVMGLNGAGKTTLMRLLSGALTPSSGRVLWEGRDARTLNAKERARHLAFVPQDFPTDFPFTVSEFAAMGRFARQEGFFPGAEDGKIANAALERLGLKDFRERLIGSLSGGERQKLLLARALVQDAPVLLLDEPLNHLDIKNRLSTLKLLTEENRAGRTITAVMHDLREVRAHFSDVLFLKDGNLFFCGSVREGFREDLLRDVFEVENLDL